MREIDVDLAAHERPFGTRGSGTFQRDTEDDLRADAERLTRVLIDLSRALQFRDRDRVCRCADEISVSQCYALKEIVDHGPLSVNQLSAELFLDKSTVSRAAHALEAKGFVEKTTDPSDRRGVRLEATLEGARLAARIDREMVSENMDVLREFDPQVRHNVTRLAARLTGAYVARVSCEGGACCVVPSDDISDETEE